MDILSIVTANFLDTSAVSSGACYWHGYRFNTKNAINSHYKEPWWLTPDRTYAGDYGYFESGSIKLLWRVTTKRKIQLATVNGYSIMQAIIGNGLRNENPWLIHKWRILPWVEDATGRTFDGLVEHGGHEVLIRDIYSCLSIEQPESLPPTRDEWRTQEGFFDTS